MNELIIQFLKISFDKANALTIVDVLVLHFHKNFRDEMYHKGLIDKYGLKDNNISISYTRLRKQNYLTFNENTKLVKVTAKGVKLFKGSISKKIAFHILEDVRVTWFEKLWKLYPIKIGKKKSKEIFLSINLTEDLFTYILSSLEKQIKYKVHMDYKDEFHPQFKHLERWIKNEEWDNEVPEVIDKKMIILGRK